jgi:ParB family transcriptional regulator, chromosome partitioning protein
MKKDFLFDTSPNLPKIVEIDLTRINPNPDQPRKTFNEEGIRELAASIERHGLISPITVKEAGDGDTYLLVAGERRFRAHQLLGKKTIFSIVTQGNPDEIALIENLQREDLNPIDEAEALARMMDRYSYTQEELGKIIGKSQNTVSEFLRMNTLPTVIKEEYRTFDTVPKSTLVAIARQETEEAKLAIWEEVKRGNVSVSIVRQAKKHGGTTKKSLSPVTKILSAGKIFIKKLETVPTKELVKNNDQYIELLELRKRINAIIDDAEMTKAEVV